jgi:hypothetical protein
MKKKDKAMLKEVEQLEEAMRSNWADLSATYNDVERVKWEKILFPQPFTAQQILDFCAAIQENVRLGKENNVIINLAARWQAYNDEQYPIVDDAHIELQRVRASLSVESVMSAEERRDMLIFLGSDHTGINRGFIMTKEEGIDYLCELEHFVMNSVIDYSSRLDKHGNRVVNTDPVEVDERGTIIHFSVGYYREITVFSPEDMGESLEDHKSLIVCNADRIALKANMTADEYAEISKFTKVCKDAPVQSEATADAATDAATQESK